MNMGNYASSCAMRFATAVLLIGSSLWMPSLSRANDNNPCLETGTWNPCNEECVPGSITQAHWDPPGNLFYACVGENFVPPKITVATSDGKIVCNNGVNTLVCSDNPHFGQNPNNPDQVVPYIGTGYFEPPIPTSFPTPGLYDFVGKAKASPAFGSCHDIYPQTIGTLTVKALKFMFRPPYVDVCWSEGGSYEASADLTFDSYDTSAMSWSLGSLDGDSSAWIDTDSGKVYFGTGGGKYILTVRSAEAPSCDASMLLYVIKYDITTSPDSPWAGDIVTYSLVPGSYVPYHIDLQWSAPNSYIECESNTTRPPTPLGGQFRIPNHMAGDYPVAVSASCGTKQKTVTSQCKDCVDLINEWNTEYAKFLSIYRGTYRAKAAEWGDKQDKLLVLKQKLTACMALSVVSCPANNNGPVRITIEGMAENLFLPGEKIPALQIAEQIDNLVVEIAALRDILEPAYCIYWNGMKNANRLRGPTTQCIQSGEARTLCEETVQSLSSSYAINKSVSNPCEIFDPDLPIADQWWTEVIVTTCWGTVYEAQVFHCN